MSFLDEVFERLTRIEEIERSAREGTLHAFLSELDGAAAVLAADVRADALRAIRAALRIDLAFLVEHPGEIFACLYNRLAWHEAAGSSVYYELPRGHAANTARSVGTEHHPLHSTLRAWRASRETSGVSWLRSLRPPEIGLQGALLEEYRADAPRYFRRLRLTSDGRQIELAYGPLDRRVGSDRFAPKEWHGIRWDRVTGRRLADSIVEVFDPDVAQGGNLRIEHTGWGSARLIDRASDTEIGHLPISESHNVGSVAYASNADLVALSGWDDHARGFVRVYDLKTRSLVMHMELDRAMFQVAISPRGDRIAASSLVETYAWEVETQRQICALPLRAAVPAFSPDARLLLTAELGVVRVWNLDHKCAFLREYRGGLSNAAFSPDGTRLVTGSWLADALTGAVIAHIDFDNIEYLEGGPPRNASVIGDERLVCLERGVEVWSARTGSKRSHDRSRRYAHRHLAALSPDGRRYARTEIVRFTQSACSRVEVLDTDSGAVLTAFDTAAVTCMAWTPDGKALATGSVDGQVRLWDAVRGIVLRSMSGHSGPVSDLAFVRGGAYLVSGADADAVRVWHVDTAEAVFSRPLTEGDPGVATCTDGADMRYCTWLASNRALDAVDRMLPGVLAAQPWAFEPRAGSLALIDRKTGEPVAWLPTSEDMAPHPSEPIWAGGPIHVRLER